MAVVYGFRWVTVGPLESGATAPARVRVLNQDNKSRRDHKVREQHGDLITIPNLQSARTTQSARGSL